jgi:hypothetical protein
LSPASQSHIQTIFQTNDAVAVDRIECRLDGQAFTSCTSPIIYDQLRKGIHQFTVRVTDAAGNAGEDRFLFTIGSPSSSSSSAAGPRRQE